MLQHQMAGYIIQWRGGGSGHGLILDILVIYLHELQKTTKTLSWDFWSVDKDLNQALLTTKQK